MSGRINSDFTQDGNSIFENVYIHGELDYQFDTIQGEKLIINKESWHGGIATFKDDVIIEGNLYLDYLKKELFLFHFCFLKFYFHFLDIVIVKLVWEKWLLPNFLDRNRRQREEWIRVNK